MKIKAFSGFLCLFFCFSCTKEGTGGKASVWGLVKHHTTIVPYARVYIKYNAQEFAGINTSVYDDSTFTGVDSKYEFSGLKKGDYALYAKGYDSTLNHAVSGGTPITLKKTEQKTIDVPVSEE